VQVYGKYFPTCERYQVKLFFEPDPDIATPNNGFLECKALRGTARVYIYSYALLSTIFDSYEGIGSTKACGYFPNPNGRNGKPWLAYCFREV
jgi:hypothetical protein